MKKRILLVDTEPNLLKGMERIVHQQSRGGNIHSAQSIDAALDVSARAASDTIHELNRDHTQREKGGNDPWPVK